MTAVVFCDVDGFKAVNDRFGHAHGDQLLVAMADRLRRRIRPTDTLARLGGDEFAVLIEATPDVVTAMAHRLLDAVRTPIEVDGRQVAVTLSAGIAYRREGTPSADSLIRDADVAMYAAKDEGRDRVARFDSGREEGLLRRHRLALDLALALDRQEFALVYQPIISLSDGTACGAEALLRWHHPDLGDVAPTEFIPIAEETGHVIAIGRWVLREACRQLRAWDDEIQLPFVSVNVSVRQLADPSFAVDAEAICRVTGIDPQRVELEITETAFAMDLEAMKVRLGALKALGFRIAIDDFGTGYSSLSYLREFPVDVIKIDRSFITELEQSAEDLLLLRGVVELAHSLQLTVVSEGVETDEQFRALQAMRCDRAQGYLFARPGDPSTIALHTGTRRDLTSTPHAVRAHVM